MRHIAIIGAAAAAILFGGALSSTSARADYNAGGPVKQGKLCWSATSAQDHGYWRACPPAAKAVKAKKGKKGKKAMKAKKGKKQKAMKAKKGKKSAKAKKSKKG
jgi:hypothetical protein